MEKKNIKQDKRREGGKEKSIRGLFSSCYLPAYPFLVSALMVKGGNTGCSKGQCDRKLALSGPCGMLLKSPIKTKAFARPAWLSV